MTPQEIANFIDQFIQHVEAWKYHRELGRSYAEKKETYHLYQEEWHREHDAETAWRRLGNDLAPALAAHTDDVQPLTVMLEYSEAEVHEPVGADREILSRWITTKAWLRAVALKLRAKRPPQEFGFNYQEFLHEQGTNGPFSHTVRIGQNILPTPDPKDGPEGYRKAAEYCRATSAALNARADPQAKWWLVQAEFFEQQAKELRSEKPGAADDKQDGKRKQKRSTERNEARIKIIAALTKHHQYADDGCLNLEPIGVSELARKADVSKATVSEFFTKHFKGHSKYRALCNDSSNLLAALKMLNGDFSPHHLYGSKPREEVEHEDE